MGGLEVLAGLWSPEDLGKLCVALLTFGDGWCDTFSPISAAVSRWSSTSSCV